MRRLKDELGRIVSILVINAGSSTVKFGLFAFETLEAKATGLLDWAGDARRATMTVRPAGGEPVRTAIDAADYRTGVIGALRLLGDSERAGQGCDGIRVVGHRLIHGGEEIRRPVEIDAGDEGHDFPVFSSCPASYPGRA